MPARTAFGQGAYRLRAAEILLPPQVRYFLSAGEAETWLTENLTEMERDSLWPSVHSRLFSRMWFCARRSAAPSRPVQWLCVDGQWRERVMWPCEPVGLQEWLRGEDGRCPHPALRADDPVNV